MTDVNAYKRDADGNHLLTPTGGLIDNPYSVQEFIVYQPTVTPEPATVFLLGTGLAGMGGMAWRRRKKQSEGGEETT